MLEGHLVHLLYQWSKVIFVVAHVENHSQDIGAVTLVQIPIVGYADLELFLLNLFAYVANVRPKICAELHRFYNFVQKMLIWTNYLNTRVVLILWFLYGEYFFAEKEVQELSVTSLTCGSSGA